MAWLERLSVEARVGDIFAADVQAIVCSATVDLAPYGAISRRMYELGGKALLEDREAAITSLPRRQLALGQAVTLSVRPEYDLGSCERLIFVALWSQENPYTPRLLYEVIINSLRQAFEHDISSLAMPIFSVGSKLVCEAVRGVLPDLDGLRDADRFSIHRLLFVSLHADDVTALQKCLAMLRRPPGQRRFGKY